MTKLNRQAMIEYYKGLLRDITLPKETKEHYENLIELLHKKGKM